MNMFRGMSGEREQKNKFSLGDLGWNGDWSWIRSLRDRWLRSSQPPPIIKGIIFYVWIKLPEATSVIDVGRGDDCYSKKGIGRRFDQFPTSMAFTSFVLFLFHVLLSSFLSFLLFVFLFFHFSFFFFPSSFLAHRFNYHLLDATFEITVWRNNHYEANNGCRDSLLKGIEYFMHARTNKISLVSRWNMNWIRFIRIHDL